MQVLYVCSEMSPLLKIGGLADAIGTLPTAQIVDGVGARVLLPTFLDTRRGVTDVQVVSRRGIFARHITLLSGHYNGVGIYPIDTPHLCDRPGDPYYDTSLFAYADSVLRLALLGQVGAETASGLDPFWRPDVVHAHNWYVDPAPVYLTAYGRPAKSVFIAYNLAYQDTFYVRHMNDIQLSQSPFNIHGLEFNGQISFLKAGLYYVNRIMAVGPIYACEITEPQFARGMEDLLQQCRREGRLSDVPNGVNEKIWSPEVDLLLASRYTRDMLKDKAENKRQLQIAMGLRVDDKVPLFIVVSHLASQKGLNLVLETLSGPLEQGGQLALFGVGDPVLWEGSFAATTEYPDQVGVQIGYHEALSHYTMGSADVILVSGHFEPCGLTQLYGSKYGTLPLVRRIGGLVGTISDCSLENLADGAASGFVFKDSNVWSLLRAIRRTFVL